MFLLPLYSADDDTFVSGVSVCVCGGGGWHCPRAQTSDATISHFSFYTIATVCIYDGNFCFFGDHDEMM